MDGILPQALQTPSARNGSYVTGQFTGESVQNVYHDPRIHRTVTFSARQTPFKANFACTSGAAGVNNDCVCPGSASGVPYRQSPPMYAAANMTSMFLPFNQSNFPPLTAAAQSLVVQRSPTVGPYSAYAAMESLPLHT